MKERKHYPKEFKQGAVRLLTDLGRSISDAASSLGVPAWSLSRWVRTAKDEGLDAFRGNGNRTAKEQEILDLRRRVQQLEEEKEILKKRRPTSPLPKVKYGFICEHLGEFSISAMCRLLEVSVSGYYDWRKRLKSKRAWENERLLSRIKAIHKESRHNYGSPKI